MIQTGASPDEPGAKGRPLRTPTPEEDRSSFEIYDDHLEEVNGVLAPSFAAVI
jgi:hypothetical protein